MASSLLTVVTLAHEDREGKEQTKDRKYRALYDKKRISSKTTSGYLMGDFVGGICLFVHTSQADPGHIT